MVLVLLLVFLLFLQNFLFLFLSFLPSHISLPMSRAHANSRLKGQGGGVEVIFVSSDRSEAQQQEYMNEAHGRKEQGVSEIILNEKWR